MPTHNTPRRVPGLRREEVALLAGVSANYYTRLEQGEDRDMSDAVLASIADALRLNETERQHLLHLARPIHIPRGEAGPETVRDSLLALVESNDEQAVFVLGRHLDLLGANRLAYALFGLDPGDRYNMAELMFFDPAMRALIVGWENVARRVAAYVRSAAGRRPDDVELSQLIDGLGARSPEFARIWADHAVAVCMHGVSEYRHPLVGHLRLSEEALRVPHDPGQQVIFLGAAPESDHAYRLRQLAALGPT